jgi:hypothetical protein
LQDPLFDLHKLYLRWHWSPGSLHNRQASDRNIRETTMSLRKIRILQTEVVRTLLRRRLGGCLVVLCLRVAYLIDNIVHLSGSAISEPDPNGSKIEEPGSNRWLAVW